MSISVLAAIVGVMVAAADTGLVGGRCIRRPGPSFIAWTTGMVALTVALLTQSIGFTTGFDPVTFRVIQLAVQLVAPVVLAWGLVELAARGPAARFGARLVAAALIVVIGVVLATDPLAARPFGTAWPSAAVHYQLVPHYALIALHLTVAGATVAAVALCAARGRGQAAQGRLVTGAAAVGGAVLSAVALRFTLPAGAAYPALSVLSAVLVWFGMTRLDGMVPGDSPAGPGGTLTPEFPGRPRAASHAGGAHGAGAAGRNGADGAEPAFRAGGLNRSGFSDGRSDRSGFPGDEPGRSGFPAPGSGPPETAAAGFPSADLPGTARRGGDTLDIPGAPGAQPVTGAIERPGAGLSRSPARGKRPGAPAIPGTDIVRPAPRPHGLIAIYTLLEDKVAAFDRIAEEAAEQVRAQEPDTLVYVIHTVPKAPMQRIFYEIYRDRAAYERHEHQPYIKQFVTARRPYVLATNVIELRLKYAKISPLMQDETQAATPVGALPGSGGQAPGSWAPAPGYGGTSAAGYGGTSAPGPGRAQADPLALDYPRAPRDSRGRGDGRTREGSRRPRRGRQAGPGTTPADSAAAPGRRDLTGMAERDGAGPDGAKHEAPGRAPRITLLGKPGCHLCEEARTVIARVAADLGVGWEERDITASSQDMAAYWDKIPVTLVDGVQHDFWRVSEDRLRAALRH